MNHSRRFAGLLTSMLFVATPAFADIPPPDACNSEGASCDNAGASYDAPGTCTKETCTRTTPDGSMTYECLVCLPSGSTDGTAGAESGADSDSDDDDGCSVAQGPTSASLGFAALTTFALAFAALRRRASARVR